jgi:2-polyprenyl-3-methyl-5-hydroxy-6-metoxy-1,4-benzoquinol methylase
MEPKFGAAAYPAWFQTELGQRVWTDERRVLDRALGDVAGRLILDVGAGDGRLARELHARRAHVIALDGSPSMLTSTGYEGLGTSLHRVQAGAMALPFADGMFDTVTAVTVLCFAPHPEEMVRELARVTKPGGRVVLGELGRWSTWALARRLRGWLKGGLWEGARFRSASELGRLLARAGLHPQQIHGAVYYPPSVLAARWLGSADPSFDRLTNAGAAFLAVAGMKNAEART